MTKNNNKETKKQEIDNIIKERDEYKDLLQRLQAEFDNFKKRLEKDMQDYKVFANRDIIISLLPILDSFDMAMKNKPNEDLKIIHNQFLESLNNFGVKKIDSLGKDFDPNLHEVLISSESDEPENKIIEVYQEGYLLNDKVIRHAKVRVSKGKPNDEEDKK